jgi:hypothetical protein
MPRISPAPITSGRSGSRRSSMMMPRRVARAISLSTVATPPRVASRMQCTALPHVSNAAATIGHSGRVSLRTSASMSNSPRASMIAMP